MENEKMNTFDVEVKIKDKKYKYCLLHNNEDDAIEIIKRFPDGFIEGDKALIPQLWWGDIENSNIIILGKNPSFILAKKDNDSNLLKNGDKEDNENPDFRQLLKDNLSYSNRKDALKLGKLLSSTNYSNIGVIQRWKSFFGLGEKITDVQINKLNRIAIFNMFGYYNTTVNNVDVKMSHIYKNNELLTELAGIINNKTVYLMWEGTRSNWTELFNGHDKVVEKLNDTNKVKALNGKCKRYSSFKDEFKKIEIKNT